VASRAIGRFVERQIGVAIATFEFDMDFIESQASNGMLEVLLVPSAMTVGAIVVEAGNFLSGGVAGTAFEFLVEAVKGPSGRSMLEGRFFFGVVTFGALVFGVAVVTDSVNFLHRFGNVGFLVQVVAITAVFLFVTVHTTQAEHINMSLVVESDHGTLFVWGGVVNFFGRNSNDRVWNTHDVGGVGCLLSHRLALGREVAEDTFGVVAPFTVTGEALAMIGAF